MWKAIVGTIAGVFAVCILASGIKSVPVGSTGVVTHWGKVQETTLSEGLHYVIPVVAKVYSMSNQVQRLDVGAAATSKDLQAISTEIVVNYHLSSDNCATVYQTVGMGYSDTLLAPAIQEVVKNVTAQYSAEQLITNRSAVSVAIRNELAEKMMNYGVVIDEFNITNFNFSAEFDAAVEAKQVAEQAKLTAQTEKEQRIIEAEAAGQVKTIAAQAEAEATLAKANAEAEAIKVKAEAEAEANKLLNASLTGSVLQYAAIDKWDGQYPQVVSGDESSLLIDINKTPNVSAPSEQPASE